MDSKIAYYDSDGTPAGVDTFRLDLTRDLGGGPNGGDLYTCHELTYSLKGSPEATLPSLEGWSFESFLGVDESGQFGGVPHGAFENLTDSSGTVVSSMDAYQAYNLFVNFDVWVRVYAEAMTFGGPLGEMRRIGDSVTLGGAGGEAPIDLGSHIDQGSTFKDAGVVLTFKGLGVVGDRPCFTMGFQSGDASFVMDYEVMPGTKLRATGGSMYGGEILLDMDTLLVRHVVMDLVDVIQMKPVDGDEVVASTVVKTTQTIRAVD